MDKTARARWLMGAASLAFAMILWYFVTWDSARFAVRDFRVPLQFQGVSEGYSVSADIQNVEVRIEGTGLDITRLATAEIQASVSISDLRPGKYRLPIQVSPPAHVRLVSHNPGVVELELFRMIERTFVPVLVPTDMPDNLMVSAVDITPSEVSVRGPEALVMPLRRAEVRGSVAELSGGPSEIEVVLVGEDGGASDLAAIPPVVSVSAQFSETMEEARIPIIARVTGIPGEGLEVANVTVSPEYATLRGPRENLLGMTEITIDSIDVTGHIDNMIIDMPLEPPSEAVSIIGGDHVVIRVEFRAAVLSRTFLNVPIHLTGVPNPRDWNISPPSAGVTVEYPVTLSAFDPDDPPLELYIDATNVVTSQLTLPILARNVMGGVSVIRIEPQQVTITEME